ncbi:MAG: hypothetical protein HY898_21560 [Deltaproteobacteria bacterium]|nr:hypothetical protein [Deltaproteobacteria bacterium]
MDGDLAVGLGSQITPRLADLVQLMCLRGRKFSRTRLAHFVLERIGASEATERSILELPPELLALFLSREARVLADDRAPVNDFFELHDGRLLEYVGDHLEATETVARLLQAHDEARLDHVIQLLALHGRSWLHMLALEVRDARLAELGLSDLDDVDRLYAPWHTVLLLRKLAASMTAQNFPQGGARKYIDSAEIPAYLAALKEPERRLALDRLRFLIACQAVRDSNKHVRKLTQKNFERSTRIVLKLLSRGLRRAGADRTMLTGPQIATIFRLGLQASQPAQP